MPLGQTHDKKLFLLLEFSEEIIELSHAFILVADC